MKRKVLGFAVFGCALLPLLNALSNRRYLRGAPADGHVGGAVSVLIPARNEAERIGDALAHALASRGVTFEIVVLDDGSADGTDACVRAFADKRVRLLTGAELPEGWAGKNHACAQLAQAARYETLLFVDADVRLAPDAIARLASMMAGADAPALLSGVPQQITVTPMEWLLLPLINVLLAGYLPVARDNGIDPGFAAACGQLVMVDAAAYRAVGGHEAVRNRLHDAIALARAMRRQGYRTQLVDATDLATCRMYETGREVWSGLAKNATEGLASGPGLILWTLLLGLGHVVPFAMRGSKLVWAARFASVALRAMVAVRTRQGGRTVVFGPLGVGLLLVLQWYALVRKFLGHRVNWRGRHYEAR